MGLSEACWGLEHTVNIYLVFLHELAQMRQSGRGVDFGHFDGEAAGVGGGEGSAGGGESGQMQKPLEHGRGGEEVVRTKKCAMECDHDSCLS